MRYALAVVILVAVVAWLGISYLPGVQGSLPVLAFTGAWTAVWLPALAGLTLAVMTGIQVWLVVATGRMVQKPARAELQAAVEQFGLRTRTEVLLTAVPVAMTVLLGIVVLFAQ